MSYTITAPAHINTTVSLPASKSIATRMLVMGALAGKHCTCECSSCDDVATMFAALNSRNDIIDVGAAGTAMRFLTAFFATQQGRTVTISGSERMHERPIALLVDALRQRGAIIAYTKREGFAPLRITGTTLTNRTVVLDGSVSSQFVTALLLIAPVTGGCTLQLTGNIASQPYIVMTIEMMRQCGITIDCDTSLRNIVVHEGAYTLPAHPIVEADWSAASYWIALQALLPQSHITLKGLSPHSLQGDSALQEIAPAIGVAMHWRGNDLVVSSTSPTTGELILDMAATPDLVPTIVTTLCLQHRTFSISGVKNLRLKESDRIEALASELGKMGYQLYAPTPDTITHTPSGNDTHALATQAIDSHNDHRIAMAMSLASTRHAGIVVNDPMVVAKSYPHYWHHLAAAGFTISPLKSSLLLETGLKENKRN